MKRTLCIALECDELLMTKVKYVFDTLFMAAGVRTEYVARLPADRSGLIYSSNSQAAIGRDGVVLIPHTPDVWQRIARGDRPGQAKWCQGMTVIWPTSNEALPKVRSLDFDLVANAFYFLASCSERGPRRSDDVRRVHADSEFQRCGVPQTIVDDLLKVLLQSVERVTYCCCEQSEDTTWPGRSTYAVVLSHDVDFLPLSVLGMVWQGARTFMRHSVRERAPGEALKAMWGLIRAGLSGRDPYGCIPEIIQKESKLKVYSSFQVAVTRRHPRDVNYDTSRADVQAYLGVITQSGFDMCLHGSYTSTRNLEAYCEEVTRFTDQFGAPKGSRQHFLCFDYDVLFKAQEMANIEYDMSIGYPDHVGSRVGFSHPFFPYCLEEDRPYNVVEIPLLVMDVTLRSYMGLLAEAAWTEIAGQLDYLQSTNGCGSVVWHPIVFGGARDPGYDELYWRLIDRVQSTGGLATDGRAINRHWRARAQNYDSFAGLSPAYSEDVS